MEFQQEKLENGLQIIGEVNPAAKSAAVGFFVKTGSRDETSAVSGVSHFLEHMLFKGTDRRTAMEVNAAFDDTGAQFNAFTSEENTVYYASVLPEYLDEVTSLWSDLMRPALRDDDFDMEKNVIKEEIAMYKDMPSFDVMDRCRTLFFGEHPCGNSVLGTAQSIDDLSSAQMREYFARRYAPNNIVVAFAGHFDWERMVSLTQDRCRQWDPHDLARETSHFAGRVDHARLGQAGLAREHLCLMSEGVSYQDPQHYAAMLLSSIVGDSAGSRYFWELVDKAVAEAASMSLDGMDGTGSMVSYVRCSPERATEVLDVLQSIFETLARAGVTKEELRMAKNKTLSALVIKNELPMGRLIDLGFNWTYLQEYRQVEKDVTEIKSVTVEDVNKMIERLKPGVFTRYQIGPD
ncbi:MAG: insulinase family protein [Planctomycetes bacterium]|nr:insulinase family protein [Planctomycetota bacterium]